MNIKKAFSITFFFSIFSYLLFSCTIDAYDKGEGELSLLTAELVEAHVGSDKQVEYVVTDQDEQLTFQKVLTAKWIEKNDTIYRAMLYYNKVATGKADVISFNRVGVLIPRDSIKGGMKTDPLHLESAWLSKTRKYLNLRLRLMMGTTEDEDAIHTIGLLRDTTASTSSNSHMTLYHDQSTIPEYYSTTTYASIPLSQLTTDTLTLTINTYNGPVVRSFSLK